MKAALEKYFFFLNGIKCLGHVINEKTMKPLKSRFNSILNHNHRHRVRKIKSCLGMLNFLRKYVCNKHLCLRQLEIYNNRIF